jgi:hypothetical protein
MDVSLHEAWHDGAPTGVEDPRRTQRRAPRTLADRGNPARANEQVPFEGAIFAVARDDRSAGNEQVQLFGL